MLKKKKNGGRVNSNYFFSQYVTKYIPKKENGQKVMDRNKFRHILRDIFDEIGNGIIDSDCGVHMEGMGYFYVFMTQKANFVTKVIDTEPTNEFKSLMHTKGRRYYICFDSTGLRTPFVGYSMDFKAEKNLKRRLKIKLLEGKRYKYYVTNFFTRKSVKPRD